MVEAIFLSASVPDPKRAPEYATTANTVAITAAVSAVVHVVLGRRLLVWGGHPAITPMIWMVAEDLGVDYGRWVQLYQSRYFEDEFPGDNERFHNITYTDNVEKDREKSLRMMRERMFVDHAFKAAVFIGGMAGIIDEFELFRQLQPNAAVVPVVSTGGAVLKVAERLPMLDADLSNDLDYVTLFHRYLRISVREERFPRPEDQPAAVDRRYWHPPVTPENVSAARRHLERAVALDSHSAQAWADLAYVDVMEYVNGWNNSTEELVVRAEQAVQKAHTIDRSIAIAHVAEGWLRRVEGDHQGAVAAFDEALRLDPNLTTAFAEKANELIYLGRAKEAPALITKAIDLSPRDPELGKFYSIMGRAYFHIKDYDKAIYWLQKSVQERPTAWFTRAYLIGAYALTGRLGEMEVQASLEEYRQKFKNWPLDPNIKDFHARKQFDNTDSEFKAVIDEMFRGLQIAKDTAGFP